MAIISTPLQALQIAANAPGVHNFGARSPGTDARLSYTTSGPLTDADLRAMQVATQNSPYFYNPMTAKSLGVDKLYKKQTMDEARTQKFLQSKIQPMPGQTVTAPDGTKHFVADAASVYRPEANVVTQPPATPTPTGGVFDLDQGNLAHELIAYGIRGGSLNLADFRRLVQMGHPEEGLKAAVERAANKPGQALSLGSNLQEYFETGKTPTLKAADGTDTGTPDLKGTQFQDFFAAMTADAEERIIRDPETREVLGYTESAGVLPLPGKTATLYSNDKKNIIGKVTGTTPQTIAGAMDNKPAAPTFDYLAKPIPVDETGRAIDPTTGTDPVEEEVEVEEEVPSEDFLDIPEIPDDVPLDIPGTGGTGGLTVPNVGDTIVKGIGGNVGGTINDVTSPITLPGITGPGGPGYPTGPEPLKIITDESVYLPGPLGPVTPAPDIGPGYVPSPAGGGGGGGAAGPDYAAMFTQLAQQSALQQQNFQEMLSKTMKQQQKMFSDMMMAQQMEAQRRMQEQKQSMANAARAGQTADIKLGTEGNRNTFGIDAFKRNLKITPQTSLSLAISAPKGSTNKMLNV